MLSLKYIYLDSNQLTGQIPPEFDNVIADLSGNRLDYPPHGDDTEMEALMAISYALIGLTWSRDVPMGRWQGITLNSKGLVTGLYLSGVQLSGEIPPEMGRLSNLRRLGLISDQLTGEIPPELGRLSNLRYLALFGNHLSGEIPPELGRLSNLEYLVFGYNRLTGEIPPELGRLSNLKFLSLDNNQLSGEIPAELGRLSNLEHLSLDDNQLNGKIPAELGRLSRLEALYLSGNSQLIGCIPSSLDGQLEESRYLESYRIGFQFCR